MSALSHNESDSVVTFVDVGCAAPDFTLIDAQGIVRSRNVMLRAFRPSDKRVITDIYTARGDALTDKYAQLKKRIAPAKTASL